jgi:acetylornithine deacetylase/succinyl-diaminopimelate desuccinylase-like protein
VIAKGGPPTILWEEPGALYLRVRVQGRHGAVLARESAVPHGGVIAHAAPVIEAIERWRTTYMESSKAPGTQVGPAAGIGSLTAGRPDKPDLFPALLEAGVYVVTVPGADPHAIAETLRQEVGAACVDGPLSACTVEVDVDEIHPAAATPPDAPIVRTARTAWRDEFGADPPPVSGWTGSTDGVVLRAHGIDTVRLGPASTPSPTDPRRDVLDLASLTAYARLYTRLL